MNSISSSNGDHEEDFYYTEIDVFDLNTQDSSGISSADSPCDQSPTNCCCESVCNCNTQLKLLKNVEENFDNYELLKKEKVFNSKSFKTKKLKEIRLDHLNKQQIVCKRGKNKKNSSLIWNKKGFLKCNSTFEIKRNRVGRPRRLKTELKINCSQPLTTNSLKKPIKQEQHFLTCGQLEYSVRHSASSPINIPGISIAHQPSYSNEVKQDLLDISYNSDQFKVGSMRPSNVGLLEQCMAKQHLKNHQKYHSNEFTSSNSTSSSGLPASIESSNVSVFSINSSLATSSSSTASSSPSSPSLLSNFSTPDQETDWFYSNSERQNDEDVYLDEVNYNADLCNKNSSSSTNNHLKKIANVSNKSAKNSNDQQENSLPFVRSARQTVTLINQQPSTHYSTTFKSQKMAGYYASLHRGIQLPSLQQFVYSEHVNSLQSSNQITQASKNSNKSQSTARRSRNRSGGKCRKKYGMENKQFWCLQCRWKKGKFFKKS